MSRKTYTGQSANVENQSSVLNAPCQNLQSFSCLLLQRNQFQIRLHMIVGISRNIFCFENNNYNNHLYWLLCEGRQPLHKICFCRLWQVMMEVPCYLSDRNLLMQILQVQAVQGVLDLATVNSLLIEKLSKVDVISLSNDEPVHFWHLFKTCFELVRLCYGWGLCSILFTRIAALPATNCGSPLQEMVFRNKLITNPKSKVMGEISQSMGSLGSWFHTQFSMQPSRLGCNLTLWGFSCDNQRLLSSILAVSS